MDRAVHLQQNEDVEIGEGTIHELLDFLFFLAHGRQTLYDFSDVLVSSATPNRTHGT